MLCFRKLPVAKKFMERKARRAYRQFPSKFFCLTAPKHFVEGPFCAVSGIFWLRRSLWKRGGEGGVSNFSVEIFLSQYAQLFRGGTF